MRCGPNVLRFSVCRIISSIFLGGLRLGLTDVDSFCVVFFCSLAVWLEVVFSGPFEPVGFVGSTLAAEIRGLALGKCLYATKSFTCAGLHFP